MRVARGRVLDVVGRPAARLADVRRVGGVRARRRRAGTSCGSRSASGTGSACSSEEADFVYKCTNYYDAATEAGIRFDDPDVGIEWPSGGRAALFASATATRRGWPRSPTTLPFTLACDGRFAPSPTGTLHLGNLRTALLAWLFARSAGARVPGADGGPRRGAGADGLGERAARGPGGDRARLGRRGRVRSRRGRRCTRGDRAGCGWPVYECFCTRAEIRAAASAPHGPLPEGAYPGTCLRLTDGERRAQARAAGRAAGAAAAGRRGAVVRSRTGCSARTRGRRRRLRACDATTARPPTTWRSWSTTPRRASARSCAARTCSTRRRGRCCWRGCSGCRSRRTRTCRWCWGPTARGWRSATGGDAARGGRRAPRCGGWPRRSGWRGRVDRGGDAARLRSGAAAARADDVHGGVSAGGRRSCWR